MFQPKVWHRKENDSAVTLVQQEYRSGYGNETEKDSTRQANRTKWDLPQPEGVKPQGETTRFEGDL